MPKSETMTVSQVATSIAAKRNIDATKAAKLLRSRIRANFDSLVAEWPQLQDAQKQNKDGNRYPPMPRALGESLIARYTA